MCHLDADVTAAGNYSCVVILPSENKEASRHAVLTVVSQYTVLHVTLFIKVLVIETLIKSDYGSGKMYLIA